MNSFIAIVCSPRSGSTLLLRLLDSHSKISAPCEIGIPALFTEKDIKYPKLIEKWRQICDYYETDQAASLNECDLLFKAILLKENKTALVLKDPRASLFINELEAAYHPLYIHLVRDARSVANSRMFDNPVDGLLKWHEYNQAILDAFSSLDSDRQRLIRYEDLTRSPEEVLGKLLEYLGFEFESSMLDFGSFDHADDKMYLWNGEKPSASKLQYDLGTTIRPMTEAPSWRCAVTQAYDALPHIRYLNEQFGYF